MNNTITQHMECLICRKEDRGRHSKDGKGSQAAKAEKSGFIINKLVGGGYEIVNGHYRWLEAIKTRLEDVPVKIVNYENKKEWRNYDKV